MPLNVYKMQQIMILIMTDKKGGEVLNKILSYNPTGLIGTIEVPGDKSISHRAVMFGAVAEGTTTIHHFLEGQDCLSTIDCFRKMGVDIKRVGDTVTIHGNGWAGLKEPVELLDVGNSGTSIRLLLGMLASQPFSVTFTGDESIAKRPMRRVVDPLRKMGATISGKDDGNYIPLEMIGSELSGIEYELPVASAQVKSAILLAGLNAKGTTTVIEKASTRDHTERMIESFGGKIHVDGREIRVTGGQVLKGRHVHVPGDISSAAFWLVAGAVVPNSHVTLKNVGLNQTRTGIIDVLKEMGANIEIQYDPQGELAEETGTITVKTSSLRGTTIGGDIIPRLIDEIPIIALLASQAKGTTVIKDAAELKVKETNRIDAVATQLGALGVKVTPTDDGLIIEGEQTLHGGVVDSLGDHRIGMTLVIASLLSNESVELRNAEAISVSYPDFFADLTKLLSVQE